VLPAAAHVLSPRRKVVELGVPVALMPATLNVPVALIFAPEAARFAAFVMSLPYSYKMLIEPASKVSGVADEILICVRTSDNVFEPELDAKLVTPVDMLPLSTQVFPETLVRVTIPEQAYADDQDVVIRKLVLKVVPPALSSRNSHEPE
jgi:hypothetical protein